MMLPSNFGTDPTLLTREQLETYVRQLQKTVLAWQHYAARLQGRTRDEMLKPRATQIEPWFVKQEYDIDKT